MACPPLARLAPLAALLATPAVLAAQMQSKPLDRANMDTTCSACQDFYRYANGNWIKRNQIPADKPMWSSFHELQDQNYAALRDVLDEAAKQARTAPSTGRARSRSSSTARRCARRCRSRPASPSSAATR